LHGMREKWMQDRDNLAQEITSENEQITYYGRECQEKDREIGKTKPRVSLKKIRKDQWGQYQDG
jgi:hypothetical protein